MDAESQSHEITRIQADCPRCKALETDIGKKIEEAVGSYRCQYTIGEDDGGDDVALVDVLTPPGESSIKLGRQECELLVDHIYNSLVPASLAERTDGDDPNDVIRRHLARGGFGDQLARHPLEQVVGMAINALEAERPRCKALEERCAKLEEIWDRILSAYMRCDGESKLVMQAVGDARAALAERGAAVVPSRSLLRYQLERALKKVEMLADRSHAQETQLAEAQAFLNVERGEREDLAELLEQLTLAVGAPNFAEAVRLAIAEREKGGA